MSCMTLAVLSNCSIQPAHSPIPVRQSYGQAGIQAQGPGTACIGVLEDAAVRTDRTRIRPTLPEAPAT